jgi:uroporphyrinogen decarboxylase
MTEMTSRERVWKAINHQEPDRVPLDIGGGTSSTLLIEGYDQLKQHLGIAGETRAMSKLFRQARLDEPVLCRLGSDTRPLTARPPRNWTPPPAAPGTYTDMWGVTWREVVYGENWVYWEVVDSPLENATMADLDRYPWPDPLDPGFTAGLEDEVKLLYRDTPYALVADGGFKSFWEQAYFLRGLEQMLMDLILNPELVSALLNKLLEINLAGTGRFLDIVGPYIQVFRTADDLAGQTAPLMSPATYRALLKPVYHKYYDFVRSKTDAKIFYHTDGNIVPLLDDLIEIGVDILNPIQVSALIETAELKAQYGDRLVFWGGVDTQRVMPLGTIEDVRAEVRKRIHDLAPGGGYVLAAVHNLQPDVPPCNILAMADACREYGRYPIAV